MRKYQTVNGSKVTYPVVCHNSNLNKEAVMTNQEIMERMFGKKFKPDPIIVNETMDWEGPQRQCPTCFGTLEQTTSPDTWYCQACHEDVSDYQVVYPGFQELNLDRCISKRELPINRIITEDIRRIGLNILYLRDKHLPYSTKRWISDHEEELIDLYCDDDTLVDDKQECCEFFGEEREIEESIACEEKTHLSMQELKHRMFLLYHPREHLDELMHSEDVDEDLFTYVAMRCFVSKSKARIDTAYGRFLWVMGQQKKTKDMSSYYGVQQPKSTQNVTYRKDENSKSYHVSLENNAPIHECQFVF